VVCPGGRFSHNGNLLQGGDGGLYEPTGLDNGTGAERTWNATQPSGDGVLVAVDQAGEWHHDSAQNPGNSERFRLTTDARGNNAPGNAATTDAQGNNSTLGNAAGSRTASADSPYLPGGPPEPAAATPGAVSAFSPRSLPVARVGFSCRSGWTSVDLVDLGWTSAP
jgi:hypothetical protein